MTDKRTPPDATAGKSRRKRAAPTIDLKATEVQPEAAAGDASPQEPVAQEPPVRAHAEPEQPQAEHEPAPAAAMSEQAGKPEDGFKITAPLLTAGAAGAAAMTLVLFALWLTGLVPIRYAGSTATRARVTALEMELHDLKNRPAQVPGNQATGTKAIDALTERIAKMEDSIAKIPAGAAQVDPALAKRVADAENAMKSLGVALTALNRRNDDLAANTAQARARADAAEKAVSDLRGSLQDVSKTAAAGASSAELTTLQQRLAALEQSAKAARADIAKASVSDKSARLALSAAALRDAVTRGAPFAAELAQAKSLGANDTDLAPLDQFAASGVPSEKALAQELRGLLPALLKASGAQASTGGFLDRLQANAEQLVRIRPLDAPPGNRASDVMARLEVEAAHDDIARALADVAKLPAAARQQAAAWVTRAVARQKALAAAQQLAESSARALAKP